MAESAPRILVTGSSRGIGAAVGEALKARGVRWIGHGRRDGPDSVGVDLAEPGAGDRLWETALERLEGHIDVLVNNAGVFEAVSVDAPLDDWTDAWARTLQINLQASADLCRRAILHWRDRGAGGRIVNVASRAAYRGDSPAHWHYAASKAGMVGMARALAREVGSRSITVNVLAPGLIATEMTDVLGEERLAAMVAQVPLARIGEADDVAAAAIFLASPAASYITGTVLCVDGGLGMGH